MAEIIKKEKPVNEPEDLIIMQSVFVREVGKEKALPKKPGNKVTVKGLDKQELLLRKVATRDLTWKPEPVKGK